MLGIAFHNLYQTLSGEVTMAFNVILKLLYIYIPNLLFPFAGVGLRVTKDPEFTDNKINV